uniref:Uncharacterized protein n=1 Tax=Anguilla anguilla TaxID=7936 RepID=A0A0E9PVM1_ANGAN
MQKQGVNSEGGRLAVIVQALVCNCNGNLVSVHFLRAWCDGGDIGDLDLSHNGVPDQDL